MIPDLEAAVFDVDGTLLDTTEGVLSAVKHTIEKHGLDLLPYEQLRSFIGPPIQNSFMKHYGVNASEGQQLADTFREQYKNVDLFKAVPYPGIYEMLANLSDYNVKLAIATYKRQDYAETLLKYFAFDRFTNVLYGADHENKMKKGDIIVKCMEDIGLHDYNHAAMIGDSDNDAIGASMIGMKFIGVTYGFGFHSDEDIMKYPHIGIAHTSDEIGNLILRG